VNTPVFGTACSNSATSSIGFTYIGQPFTYMSSPVITAIAQALGGTTTLNYTGSLMRLTNGSLTGRTYTPSPSSNALTLTGLPATSVDPTIADLGTGSVTLTFSAGSGLSFTRTTATAPFSANISLSQNVIDLDSVAAANPVTFGTATGISFSSGATQEYGRLVMRSSVGSELLDLPVPLTAQYYVSGTQGFTTNAADNCTVAPTLAFTHYQMNLKSTCVRDSGSPGASGVGCPAAATSERYGPTATSGSFNLNLAAPGSGNNGAVTVTATGPSWLSNPSAIAAFGEFPGPASRVYQREVY
jgi:MSHA biogenesis protein MshQ